MSDEEPVCPLPALRKACEPRCADVFAHYLTCAERIKQKGAGARAASEPSNPSPTPVLPRAATVDASFARRVSHGRHIISRTTRHRATARRASNAGDCEPYYFDWLKCIDKCAMPHIMQKLK